MEEECLFLHSELRSNVVFLGFQAAILSTLIPSSNFTPSITAASQLEPLSLRHIR